MTKKRLIQLIQINSVKDHSKNYSPHKKYKYQLQHNKISETHVNAIAYLQTLHLQLNSLQGAGEEAETGYRVPSLHQVAIDLL